MIDIIVLIFLTRHIGRLAEARGEHSLNWKIYTILGWFIGLFMGGMVGMLVFEIKDPMTILKPENAKLMMMVFLVSYLFAVMGYHVVLHRIKQKPLKS